MGTMILGHDWRPIAGGNMEDILHIIPGVGNCIHCADNLCKDGTSKIIP